MNSKMLTEFNDYRVSRNWKSSNVFIESIMRPAFGFTIEGINYAKPKHNPKIITADP